jgi:hypothetical protein
MRENMRVVVLAMIMVVASGWSAAGADKAPAAPRARAKSRVDTFMTSKDGRLLSLRRISTRRIRYDYRFNDDCRIAGVAEQRHRGWEESFDDDGNLFLVDEFIDESKGCGVRIRLDNELGKRVHVSLHECPICARCPAMCDEQQMKVTLLKRQNAPASKPSMGTPAKEGIRSGPNKRPPSR